MNEFDPYLNWIDGQYTKMLDSLITLVEINSHSQNCKGLDDTMRLLLQLVEPLGGEKEIITFPGSVIQGKALRIMKRKNADLKIFLCCHMDTVYPADSLFQKTCFMEDNRLSGPGVADCKGGIIVMITALAAFEKSPWADRIGWEILVTSDEELGSPASGALLMDSAVRNDIGLVYEPAFPDGGLASSRMGSGNFTAVVYGQSAHVGRDFRKGLNAIVALASFTSEIDKLNNNGRRPIINPGFIQGGGPVNVVPDNATLKFNIRISKPEDESWIMDEITRIKNQVTVSFGTEIEISGGFTRKPKILTPENSKLLRIVQECGKDLGMEISSNPTGGCCDGNNLAAKGLPNADTMGVRGGGLHSQEEYILLDSLTQRTKLSALLLMKLASGQIKWKKGEKPC